MSSYPDNTSVLIHQYGQTVTWCILLNISILSACLSYKKIASTLHAILGALILFLTYFFILWFLVPYGFNAQYSPQNILNYLHAVIGCALLGLIVVQCAVGLIAKFYKDKSK